MKRELARLAGVAVAVFGVGSANAAEIRAMKLDDGVIALLVAGDIASDDGAKFRKEASKYDEAFVLLESEGGSLAAAIDIGETIRLKGYATAVINRSSCNSACALIWLAGTPRALSRSGRIGFHAAYSDNSGTARESGVANAMVGRYLTLLNLPEKALVFATSAPPSKLSWLTSKNYGSTGIELTIIDDIDLDDEKSPSKEPPPIIRVTKDTDQPETELWKRVDPWIVAVDHTLDNGCFVLTSYERNTVFRVGINRSSAGKYYVIFGNPAWKSLTVGKEYDVQFQFDDNSPWEVPATAIDMGGTLLMSTFSDPTFWSDFIKSYNLEITYGGERVTELSMSGTSAAFDELVSCQRYHDSRARSADPFAR